MRATRAGHIPMRLTGGFLVDRIIETYCIGLGVLILGTFLHFETAKIALPTSVSPARVPVNQISCPVGDHATPRTPMKPSESTLR